MRNILIIFTFVVFCSFVSDDPFRLVIRAKFDRFTGDNIGNIYTIKDDELIKYLPNGKQFARYSNLKLGTISHVDASNPLKVLIYYRDFQTIVFLDNQLSQNSDAVSLEKMGYEQTDLVCASVNNSFWIYNKQNNELLRFNENSKKTAATGNLKQVLQTEINPDFMLESNNYLYLNSPDKGIYVFDIFGAFSKIISIKDIHQFQVNENIIYFKRDSSLCSYDHKLFEEGCKKVPGGNQATQIQLFKDRIYCGFKDSIRIH
ncbi:MAG: hypothetical protein K0S12_2042 [Bacteroidetes bacterium]|nr:hypothetical protein [Bacteroidota bacterium]